MPPQTANAYGPGLRPAARLESWAVFLVAAGVCMIAGLAALRAAQADWEALAALSHALDVVAKEPRFNLALIGFAAPPVPALLYLPFAGFTPSLATSGMACPLLGAVMVGLTAMMLNALAAQAGLGRLLRWPLVLVFLLHPLVLSLGALGSPGSVLMFAIAGAAWALARWSAGRSFRDMLACSLFLTVAVLTAYDAVWLALTAAAYVAWRTYRTREGWSRMEGTLIAFLLPLVYAAAVWVGANWAIMGDPWHFRHAAAGAPGEALPYADRLTVVLWVMLICCPPLLGLLYHELAGGGGRRRSLVSGRAAAWLVVGAAVGAILSPGLRAASGGDLWQPLMTLAVSATAIGYGLLATVGARRLARPDDGRMRPVGGVALLVGLGLVLVAWTQMAAGVGLPVTPGQALRGKVAFADRVQPEQAAAGALVAHLHPDRRAYLIGPGPRYVVSLFSGRPDRIVMPTEEDIARLPLEAGDLLVAHDAHIPRALYATLRAKHLRAVPVPCPEGCEERWAVFRLERPTPQTRASPVIPPSPGV